MGLNKVSNSITVNVSVHCQVKALQSAHNEHSLSHPLSQTFRVHCSHLEFGDIQKFQETLELPIYFI